MHDKCIIQVNPESKLLVAAQMDRIYFSQLLYKYSDEESICNQLYTNTTIKTYLHIHKLFILLRHIYTKRLRWKQ